MKRLLIPALALAFLLTGCGALLDRVGIGAPRSAKLPIPVCPEATLTLEEGWQDGAGRTSLTLEDRRTLDRWILGWQDCARKRGAVIEEANK